MSATPTLPTLHEQMDLAPNACNVPCDWCERGVVERRVDDWSPDCGAGYEYLYGSALVDGSAVCSSCVAESESVSL